MREHGPHRWQPKAANAGRSLAFDAELPCSLNTSSSGNLTPDTESDEEEHVVCSSPAKKEPELADVIRQMESSLSELP